MAALLGNAGLAVLKATAAGFTGSSAMLAETFHSIADPATRRPRRQPRVRGLLLRGRRATAAAAPGDLGPTAILVAASAHFQGSLSTTEIERAVGRLHAAIGKRLDGPTTSRLILIEPAPAGGPEGVEEAA